MPDAPLLPPIDYTYRYRPGAASPSYQPKNHLGVSGYRHEWESVASKLIEGNLIAVRYIADCRAGAQGLPARFGSQVIELSDSDLLLDPLDEYGFPLQLPVALVLGCVDARAPAEIIFGVKFVNNVFNVRVAGNVVAEECVGSIEFALRHLVFDAHQGEGGDQHEYRTIDPARAKRLRLLISLGHEGCGAVAEAVRAFQTSLGQKPGATGSLAALLGHLFFPALIIASEAYDSVEGPNASRDPERFGPFSRLVAYVNAAWGARVMQDLVRAEGKEMVEAVGVVYGVHDPRDMHVRAVPSFKGQNQSEGSSFGLPPKNLDALRNLALRLSKALRSPGDMASKDAILTDRVFSAALDG